MYFLKSYFDQLVILLTKLNVFKNLSYFVTYFDTVEQLNSGNKLPVFQIYFSSFIILIRSFHLTVFAFFNFSHRFNVVQFNFVYLDGLESTHNFVFIIFLVLSVYYMQIFYFHKNCLILNIMKDILVHGKNNFFLNCSLKNVKLGKWENNKLFLYVYKAENISANIQKIAITWRNVMQVLYYAVGIEIFSYDYNSLTYWFIF